MRVKKLNFDLYNYTVPVKSPNHELSASERTFEDAYFRMSTITLQFAGNSSIKTSFNKDKKTVSRISSIWSENFLQQKLRNFKPIASGILFFA